MIEQVPEPENADLFFQYQKPELLEILDHECNRPEPDLEILSYVFGELKRRNKIGKAESILSDTLITPIPWLSDARSRIRDSFDLSDLRPGFVGRLYVVLLQYDDPDDLWVYVGSTSKDPTIRYAEHKKGIRSSAKVRTRGVQLLPSLWPPTWQVPGKQILWWETALHRCLEQVLPSNRVKGDVHDDEIPNGFQPKIFESEG